MLVAHLVASRTQDRWVGKAHLPLGPSTHWASSDFAMIESLSWRPCQSDPIQQRHYAVRWVLNLFTCLCHFSVHTGQTPGETHLHLHLQPGPTSSCLSTLQRLTLGIYGARLPWRNRLHCPERGVAEEVRSVKGGGGGGGVHPSLSSHHR